jgi:hypothetical protein
MAVENNEPVVNNNSEFGSSEVSLERKERIANSVLHEYKIRSLTQAEIRELDEACKKANEVDDIEEIIKSTSSINH